VKADWTFHEGQWRIVQSKARVRVVCAGRRYGKGIVGGREMIRGAAEDAAAGVRGISWVVAPTFRLLRTMWRIILREAPEGLITKVAGTVRQPDYIVIGETETIEFRSADNPDHLVGEGVRRLLVDEAAQVSREAWERALRPTLLDHGAPALLVSTPRGHNWFWEEWQRGVSGVEGYESFHGTSWENPFIDRAELERIAATMDALTYEQEILARFVTRAGAVFRDVGRVLSPEPSTQRTMVLGVDFAKKQDWTVILGLDAEGHWTVFQRFRKVPWTQQRMVLMGLWQRLGEPTVIVDETGLGDVACDELRAAGMPVHAIQMQAAKKRRLIEQLALAIERGKITLPDDPVVRGELEAYEMAETPGGTVKYRAAPGQHDDVVSAAALAWSGLAESEVPAFFFF